MRGYGWRLPSSLYQVVDADSGPGLSQCVLGLIQGRAELHHVGRAELFDLCQGVLSSFDLLVYSRQQPLAVHFRSGFHALAELLPLDAERRTENEVWLAFTARAMIDPELRSLRDEAYEALRNGCRGWVERLLPGATDTEAELETERLFALLDGLAVHAAMRPRRATPERLLAVLDHHLDQLAAS